MMQLNMVRVLTVAIWLTVSLCTPYEGLLALPGGVSAPQAAYTICSTELGLALQRRGRMNRRDHHDGNVSVSRVL